MQKCLILEQVPSLYNAKTFKDYKILEILSEIPEKYRRRLAELGFVFGTKVKVIRKSFQGKTMLVEIRGFVINIRKEIAEGIIVGEI